MKRNNLPKWLVHKIYATVLKKRKIVKRLSVSISLSHGIDLDEQKNVPRDTYLILSIQDIIDECNKK
jgi:hypothetical protein